MSPLDLFREKVAQLFNLIKLNSYQDNIFTIPKQDLVVSEKLVQSLHRFISATSNPLIFSS